MTMIHLALLGGILSVCTSACLITEALRDGRRRLLFALAVPVLFAWPFLIYTLGEDLLGYATDAPLPANFILVHAYTDDSIKAVYALVRIDGEMAPRLYRVSGNFDSNRKSFAKAQLDVSRGHPVSGRRGDNSHDDNAGTYVFYETPPENIPPKEE